MPIYSHSKLSCFEDCRLRYKFSYIDRLEAEVGNTVEAFLGDLVHQTMEKLYRDKLSEKLDDLAELLAFFEDLWLKEWADDIIINTKGLTKKNYHDMGIRFITDYYNHYKPFNQGKIIGVETKELIDLGQDYKIHARIDRLMKVGDVYEIHDYKTNKNLPSQAKLDEDRQLALYSFYVRENFKDAHKIRLVWHFLAFDEEMVSSRTVSQLTALKKEILSLIHTIENEKRFSPTVSSLCSWCEFQPQCPEWKHKYKTIELPANKYLKEDGVKLVNKYASVYAQKKKVEQELEKELEDLKEALIKYSKDHEVNTIFGSDKKISVKEYESIKVPSKGTDARTELEELLHKLKKWSEVSGLDSAALKKAVENWPEDIRKKVEKYFEIENGHRISLGKNEE